MYAIIRAGGKQYRVEKGDVVRLERLEGTVGASVTLGDVLLVSSGENEVTLGSPLVEGASVVATVIEQSRSPKLRIFKYKKRKHYRRTRGHRQHVTAVRIDAVRAS